MKASSVTSWIVLLILLACFALNAAAVDFNVIRQKETFTSKFAPYTSQAASADAVFNGSIKVYIVEPTSRWRDHNNHTYENGFLDWGLESGISIEENSVWETTFIWNATEYDLAPITEDNIMAISVIYGNEPFTGDAYPPYGYYFTGYYNEAAAAGLPGEPGKDYEDASYSHTIFIEEATATY